MNRLFYVIIWILVLFSITNIYFTIPKESDFYTSADEGRYFKYASAVATGGLGEFRKLAKQYVQDKNEHLFPSPLRAGHILATSLWFRLFGISFVSLARFSWFCFILFLLVSFYFCKKYFDRDLAHFYVLLLSSSPLLMAMARRALSDSNANLFCCIAVWLFFVFLKQQNKINYCLFLLFFCFAISIKLPSLLLLPFFILSFLLYKYVYKNKISNLCLVGTIFIPVLLLPVFYLVLFGNFQDFLLLVKAWSGHYLTGTVPSSYAILFNDGPWYTHIIHYLLLSPITTLLFIGYFCYTLLSRKFVWRTTYFFNYFLVYFIIVSNLKYARVARHILNLEMVVYLFSVVMLYELFRQKTKLYQLYLVFASSVLIFFLNYFNFMDIFYYKKIYDPVSYWLLMAKNIIPKF
ncbi:MAG: glycosyltransferase family 39 protein [Candidatus Omnitrophica bacterium]|nr:glycosyltransferase family 39 protein [Candidatus Omnitrophota bacterium]